MGGGKEGLLQSTVQAYEELSESLIARHECLAEVDLAGISPLMLKLRETLPAPTYKFLLTLMDTVFSKLDPEHCEVPVMSKKIEAALKALTREVDKSPKGGELPDADRLFDKLAGALSSMLRDVVPDHERCVRDARARAVLEAEAVDQAGAAQDKAAAKAAKKEKMRREAAERKERLAAKSKGGAAADKKESEERGSGSETLPGSPTGQSRGDDAN